MRWKNLRVSYTWGYDYVANEKAGLLKDLVVKKTAVEVLRAHDSSILLKTGADRLSFYDKLRELNNSVDRSLSLLEGLIIE